MFFAMEIPSISYVRDATSLTCLSKIQSFRRIFRSLLLLVRFEVFSTTYCLEAKAIHLSFIPSQLQRRLCFCQGERRYACCYCTWSGVDNWCLKRHLNTHLKPFACALCEYKAARAERLATHVHKVHNKKSCGKCPFLADDQHQLAHHLREAQ